MGVERGFVAEVLAAALFLRAVERKVSIAHQRFNRVAITRADRRADTGADVQRVVVNLVGLRQQVDNAGGNLFQPARIRGIADHDGELVTAEAATQFVLGHDRLQSFRDARQQLVADQVAKGIVDRLEPVEVDHQEGALGPPLRGIAQRFAEGLGHHHAVRQAGQGIEARHMRDLFRALALGGDVRADAAEPVEAALVIELGRSRKLPPAQLAVDMDAHDQVGKALAALQPFGQVMQARRELPGFPGRPGNQLDKGLAVDLVGALAQRKGEARADRADPARGINLPQPVGLTLFELAQQQRYDLVLLGHAGLGDSGDQERAGVFDRADDDDGQPDHRDNRHFELAGPHQAGNRPAPGNPGKQQIGQRNRRQQHRRGGEQHRRNGPELKVRGPVAERRKGCHRHNPGHGIGHRCARLTIDFIARHAAAVGVNQSLVDHAAVIKREAQQADPGQDQRPVDNAGIEPADPDRRNRLSQNAGLGDAGQVGILQAAQPRPVCIARAGEAKHRHDRQFARKG